MKVFFSSLLFLLFAMGVMLVPASSLFAQTSKSSLSVSPAFQEISLKQGENGADFFVTVSNTSALSYKFSLSVVDFGSLDEAGGVAFLGASQDLEKKYALASWMRPEKDTLFLNAGETEKVRITVENRESLSPGGHYGAVIFRISADETIPGNEPSVAINQLFSVLVFAKKIGGEIYKMEYKGFEWNRHLWSIPEDVRIRFQNSGNVHVTPRGKVTVIDPFKRVVFQGVINEASALILPESTRIYPVSLSSVSKALFPGKYTLSLAYRYDGKEDFEVSEQSFFFIPPLFLAIFGILIVVLSLYGKKRQKK